MIEALGRIHSWEASTSGSTLKRGDAAADQFTIPGKKEYTTLAPYCTKFKNL